MDQKKNRCRFIPVRRPDIWSYFSTTSPEVKTSLMQNIYNFQNRNYEQVLRQLFKIPGCEQSLLFPSIKPVKECWEKQWPARPRKKPYIRTPHLILDLPLFNNDIAVNTIDWGPPGLVCALRSSLYLWKKSETIISFVCVDEVGEIITSVKCHPAKSIIAVGTSKSRIKVWNINPIKLSNSTFCCLNSFICALEWHPTKLCVISGCSRGCLMSFYFENPCYEENIINIHGSVNSILFSQSGDLMATASIDGHLVLWDWKSKIPIADVSSLSTCKSFAWHPWNSILAIGTTEDDGTIHIVFTKSDRKMVYKSITPMKVLNLTWSKITGELVASVLESRGCGDVRNTILIFGSLGEIVDIINVDDIAGNCCYLIWSPDGYEIGTVTQSEVLLIWKFCEERKNSSKGRRTSSNLMKNKFSCIFESFGGISSTIRDFDFHTETLYIP